MVMLIARMAFSEEGSDIVMVCSASWSSRWHAASQWGPLCESGAFLWAPCSA